MANLTYLPDARPQVGEQVPEPLRRYLLAIACVVLPVAFYFFALNWTVKYFVQDFKLNHESIVLITGNDCPDAAFKSADGKASEPLAAAARTFAFSAADGTGRFGFAIPSAFLTLIALLTCAYALRVMSRRAGLAAVLATGLLVTASGFLLTHGFEIGGEQRFKIGEQTQRIFTDAILKQADLARADNWKAGRTASPPSGSVEPPLSLKDRAHAQIAWNLFIGVGGTLATLVGMGFVAIRARPEELTAAVLRQRLSDFQYLMAAAAAILILTTIITKGAVGWTLGLICPNQRSLLEGLGAALSNYWGASATGVLLAALLPGYLSWSGDVQLFAQKAAPEASYAARTKLIAEEGLEFHPATSLLTLASVATPALIGPFLEALKPLVH